VEHQEYQEEVIIVNPYARHGRMLRAVGFVDDAKRSARGFIDEADRCGGGSSHRRVARDSDTEADKSDAGGRERHGRMGAARAHGSGIRKRGGGLHQATAPAGDAVARAGWHAVSQGD
jgi:hypothetical protein